MRVKRQIAFILIINIVIGLCTGSGQPFGGFLREEVYGATADSIQDEFAQGTAAEDAMDSKTQEETVPSDSLPSTDGAVSEGTEEENGTGLPTEGAEGTEDTELPTEGIEGTEAAEEITEYGVNVLSDAISANVPENLEALNNSGMTHFYIHVNQDWLNLQALSAESDLKGYTFEILYNLEDGRAGYDFTQMEDFQGIGSEAYPFRGELFDGYATGINLHTHKSLFAYLSNEATLRGINIRTQGCSAGLSQHFVAEGDAPSLMNFTNVLIAPGDESLGDGTTDIRSDDAAGGLFSDVVYLTDAPLELRGNNITVSSYVSGVTAGGIIGNLNGGDVSGREITLVLDGGITWAPYSTPLAGNTAAKAVGGWIGKLTGVSLTVRSGEDGSAIEFTRAAAVDAQTAKAYAAGDVGGLFGLISDSTVKIENAITYTGQKPGGSDYIENNTQYDLCGENAGSFAGRIADSKVMLNAEYTANYVRFCKISRTALAQGIGGFAGVMENSVLETAENAAAISLNNIYIRSQDNNQNYNAGGIVGYAKDSRFLFTKDSPCTITDFASYNIYGNTAAAIGKYVADQLTEDDSLIMRYVKVAGGGTRIIARGGAAGGLAAYVQLADASVEISDCSVENISYLGTKGAFAVAEVHAAADKSGRLILNNIVCNGTASAFERATAFGGMIGYADADFTVQGDFADNTFSSAVWYKIGTGNLAPVNVGAVAGQVVNSTKDASGYREADISDLLVGSAYETYATAVKKYGGLIGWAGDKTSICLDGKIYQNGGLAKGFSDAAPFAVEAQQMYLNGTATDTYFGSIAGYIDNTLVYLQPTAEWQQSSRYQCNEIGNYGGMIRNGNWDAAVTDPADGTVAQNPDNWIIQNHQVTGSLGNTLSTHGDFIRFAVAMNTCGGFLPGGSTYDQIRTNTYTLTGNEYNLRWLGIMSMGRNDAVGMQDANAFQGSWNGPAGGTTLIYGLTSCRQPYIGLFPRVSGKDGAISFTNLKLEYDLSYQAARYANGAADTALSAAAYVIDFIENAGGLAVYADGAITVSNVEYAGTFNDLYNRSDGSGANTEYFGGIFGRYTVYSAQTLRIEHIKTGMQFTQRDYHHIFGGVIAYVDNSTNNSQRDGQISIRNVELNGEINIAVTSTSYQYYQNIQDSAFITKIGDNNNSSATTSETQNLGAYTKRCTMSVEDLTVGNVVQKASSATKQYASMSGFLGYSWINTEVLLKDIHIGTGSSQTPCELDGRAVFGGLLYQANGKMTVENLDVQNWTINARNNTYSGDGGSGSNSSTSPNEVKCGLLIRNGQYLYLSISGYNIGGSVVVANYSGTWFDEIVGFNKSGNYGGILSVNSQAGEGRHLQTGADYFSYPNETALTVNGTDPVNKGNPNTRYYYDLDKINFDADYTVWKTASDVMVWHVLHYAVSTLRPCIREGFTSLPTKYTVASDISMEGYSIYPTPITDNNKETYTSDGKTVTLYAQEIIDGENMFKTGHSNYYTMYPDNINAQHYQMHAGLFANVTRELTVSGLHFSGTYSRSNGNAGVLVTNEISSKGTFENIELHDLWCVSSSTINYEAPIGLLIARVIWNGNENASTNLTFTDISMTGYKPYGEDGDTRMAASALIGTAGNINAKNIKLLFREMGMTDFAATARLAKASLIYQYDYKEDCTGIYTFTYDDYRLGKDCSTESSLANRVTVGLELDAIRQDPDDPVSAPLGYDKIEYFDKDYAVGKNPVDGTVLDNGYNSGDYLPYVYTGKREIIVNPKVGHITQGCGTYEDPYVIDSARQIITLYRYLYEEPDYEEMLGMQDLAWQVNRTGDDSAQCDKTGISHVLQTYQSRAENTPDTFPTKSRLSQAYYQITDDIDLSEFQEFLGFGTAAEPFVGVFVGAKKGDGTFPEIILSKQPDDVALTQYGWIRNAKGVVIKDLTVRFASQINISSSNYSTEYTSTTAGFGGGVIAKVLGGENIIDNVTVSCNTGKETVSLHPNNVYAMIGGYVGVVELGGVILRNMTAENLKDFRTGTEANPDNYWYTCGIIGRVRDGYVIYDGKSDGTTDQTKPLMSDYGNSDYIDYTNSLPASRSYDIINAEYIRARIGLNDTHPSKGIQWTGTGYEIANDAQLLILSMAMNAGMMDYNYNYDSYHATVSGIGYNDRSRQRGGDYSYIGNVGAAGSDSQSAYRDVIRNDNANGAADATYHSYLMEFFVWNGHSILDGAGHSAVLNPYVSAAQEPLTYTLTTAAVNGNDTTVYNMEQYQTGFRGFGARYHRTYNNVFQSNMKGPESGQARIKLSMKADEVQSATRVALLNEIRETGKTLELKNLILSGTVTSTPDRPTADSYYAAGFASHCASPLAFDNVDLDDLTVIAPSYAGGYVAYMTGAQCSFECTDLIHVEITGGKNQRTAGYGHTGGFIGCFAKDTAISSVTVSGTETSPILVYDIKVSSEGERARVGGLIGSSIAKNNHFTYMEVKNIEAFTQKSAAWGSADRGYTVAAAGILGYAEAPVAFDHVTVGSTDENDHIIVTTKWTSTPLPVNVNAGSGGFIGRLGASTAAITMTDCALLGVQKDDGSYTTQISGYSGAGGVTSNSYAATVTNLTIDGVFVTGGRNLGGYCGFAELANNAVLKIELSETSIRDCHFSMAGAISGSYSNNTTYPAGDIGGLIGHDEIKSVLLTDCEVSNVVIDADYTGRVGGLIGYGNKEISIKQTEGSVNAVKDSLICGVTAGGLFGQFEGTTNNSMDGITVSGNRIVSGYVLGYRGALNYRSGGFAGHLNHTGALYFNDVSITDNLIAAYPNTTAYMGGMIGENSRGTIYVYHAKFKDNYIGEMNDITAKADAYYQSVGLGTAGITDRARWQTYLKKGIVSADWKNLVYAKKDTAAGGAAEAYASLGALPEDDLYQYSYHEGAVAGGAAANSMSMNTFVDINIQYTDNAYRPVSDVGMTGKVDTNEAMYAAYRKNYFIVYDGKETESATESRQPDWAEQILGTDVKYTFGNLEDIWSDYFSGQSGNQFDRRYVYRFGEDYLGGENSDISIENVYDLTYKNKDGYISPLLDQKGAVIPMVYFQSADAGSLDEVIQTYINMLTNNSGALNSFTGQKVQVVTKRMLLKEGIVSEDTSGEAPSVSTRSIGTNQVQFVNRDAEGTQTYDWLDADCTSGTFTLIEISYQNNKNSQSEWTLAIPIFVEQRLEIGSNARILKGIQYNVDTVISKGKYISDDSRSVISLDTGSSYSMYFEYIYNDARDKYPGAEVPKQLCMDSNNNVPFQTGTQMTLIDLEDHGKPYYYEVTGKEKPGYIIDFENFKDSAGNSYENRDISDKTVLPEKTYTDICEKEYEKVAVERYLLLVNRSGLTGTGESNNYSYELHVSPEKLKDTNPNLYNRLDWTEHCYPEVNETRGLTCEQKLGNVDEGSKIGTDGVVGLQLQYLLTLDMAYWLTNDDPKYVDIGFYLTEEEDGAKIALPQGTQIFFEKGAKNAQQETVFVREPSAYVVHGTGMSTVYYYDNCESNGMLNILDIQNVEELLDLRVVFDFSQVDPAALQFIDLDADYYVHADVVTFENGEKPVDGEKLVADRWKIGAEIDSYIGFALNVDQLMELGMNQYLPEKTDAGMISYLESIEFSEEYINLNLHRNVTRYYTIAYKLEEKTQQVAVDQKPVYNAYAGSNISLYLGNDPTAAENQITGAETYAITSEMIRNGTAFLPDKSVDTAADVPAGVIQIPCILAADRDELDWTNYRIHAYLLITDEAPTEEQIANMDTSNATELLNDYFVFTVAKVKTDME